MNRRNPKSEPPLTDRSGATSVTVAAIGAAASIVLSVAHVFGASAPGCGPKSGCEEAARSDWALLPGTGVPVAFIGAAYFVFQLGLVFAKWPIAGSRGLIWVTRLGALMGLGYLALSARERLLCPYCLLNNACAIVLWVIAERSGRRVIRKGRPLRWVPFAASSLVLASLLAAHIVTTKRAIEDANYELSQSAASAPAASSDRAIFSGRYSTGASPAAVRVVIFTDYQCADCRTVEMQAEKILASRADVSVSIKHFPFCADCNRHVPRTLHPNACRAARVVEAAGELGGSGGFWKVHRWLFGRGGKFTDSELQAELSGLGFERTSFNELIDSVRISDRIFADVEEGMRLGLAQTPMIFINGVELKGWNAPNALARAIEVVAAKPGVLAPESDIPPTAAQKAVADWQENPPKDLGPGDRARAIGAEAAPVSVVMFGDYQHEMTREANARIRSTIETTSHVRYEFRHFPVNSQCNPASPRIAHPMACRMAKAAQAAAMMGGPEFFWAVHEWILNHQRDFTDSGLRRLANQRGMNAETLLNTAILPEVAQAIEADCVEGGKAGVIAVPAIFVNGKLVARWKVDGVDVLGLVIQEALRETLNGRGGG